MGFRGGATEFARICSTWRTSCAASSSLARSGRPRRSTPWRGSCSEPMCWKARPHVWTRYLEDLAAYAIHKNTQTIKKYARRNPIHLHLRVAQADTLSTVIEGLYDPEAAAQGAPSVRWFLGYDADGTPQFCGLPAHHTCPHRMDCSRCGLFIGGERANLVHDDSSLLRVTAEVPMTEVQRLLNEGQREAAAHALEAAKEIPAPVPPIVAFLTNPAGLSDARLKELADLATQDAYEQLTLVANDLIATLVEHRTKDGRNVAVTALGKRLAFVQRLIQLR